MTVVSKAKESVESENRREIPDLKSLSQQSESKLVVKLTESQNLQATFLAFEERYHELKQ